MTLSKKQNVSKFGQNMQKYGK